MKHKIMSTIQITKQWQPDPSNNLVSSNSVKEGKNVSTAFKKSLKNSHFSAEDLMGLSWVLFDDVEDTSQTSNF